MKTRRHTVDSCPLVSESRSLDATTPQSLVSPTTMIAASDDALTNTTIKSNVWEHFERSADISSLKAKCLLCKAELLTPNYATTSLRRHLIQRHGLQQFGSIQTSCPPVSYRKLSKQEKRKLDSLAVDAIIHDSRVFGDFQKSGFRKFVDALKLGKNSLWLSSKLS